MSRARATGRPVTGWRRLAGASWRAPSDPQFFGSLDVDAAALLAFIDDVRKHTATHLTMTHLVGRAVAHGLASVPAMRQRLSRGREYDRESVDVFFIVTTDDGKELTGVKIERADTKSAIAISDELDDPARCHRSGAPTRSSAAPSGCSRSCRGRSCAPGSACRRG